MGSVSIALPMTTCNNEALRHAVKTAYLATDDPQTTKLLAMHQDSVNR